MDEHLTFDNMELNTEYECVKYKPIYDRSGLYYILKVRKDGESNEKTMVITDGCIFDKLNE